MALRRRYQKRWRWDCACHSSDRVDPEEHLVVTCMSKVMPANGLDDNAKFRALIYSAMVDWIDSPILFAVPCFAASAVIIAPLLLRSTC